MTKIIVQLYVENLLKVLKVLKTRTALKMNGLAELRMRYARQGAKALSKQRTKPGCKRRLQIYYKTAKSLKNLLTNGIIESEKERGVNTMKEYKFLVRVYFKNGTKEQRTWIETTKDAKEKAKKCREEANVTKVTLYRIDQTFDF